MNRGELTISSFNRENCKTGIVHLGVGNFHRAHQANYIDEYLNTSNNMNWGICGINLRKEDSKNFENLKLRKGKYILKTISTSGDEKYKDINSIIKLIDWSKDKDEAEGILSNPDIKLVTMTITESGYYINEKNKLNLNLELIKNNIQGKENNIIYSFLMAALKKRMLSINKKITLLCCDNIRENGIMLKDCLKQYLSASKEYELLEWIENNVSFPSCVVDRITPRTPEFLKSEIMEKFNLKENCGVIAEPFIQWIVEDNFINERPKLEDVGVRFVKDVFPYEEAKIRILNGAHLALSYFGALKGYTTYDEAISDKNLEQFFFEIQRKEILPALIHKPFDLEEYMITIYERFKNKNIADKLERIAMDGVGKFPIFILPTIHNCFEKNIIPENCIDAIASWYVFMLKIKDKKLSFEYYEPSWEWIKYYLEENKIVEFTNCVELWGNTPKQFSLFSEILEKKINFLKDIY